MTKTKPANTQSTVSKKSQKTKKLSSALRQNLLRRKAVDSDKK